MTSWGHLSEALPQLATPAEVGEQLSLSPTAVSRLCRAGKLPGVKVAGRWLVHVAKLAAQLDQVSAPGERTALEEAES